MTVPEIIAKLTRCGGAFPQQAVTEAIARRDAVVPELLRILEDATSNIAEIARQEDYGEPPNPYLLR